MANSNKVNGFTLIGTLDGSPVNGNIKTYQMTGATAIFIGDCVKLDDATGLVAPAAAGDELLGVCIGIKVDRSIAATEHPGYAPGSSGAYLQIAIGPNYLYEAQEGSGSNLTQAAVGSNVNITAGAGSTTLGVSGHLLDQTSVTDGAPASAQFRLVELVNRVDNDFGAYARWVVKINKDHFTNLTGI